MLIFSPHPPTGGSPPKTGEQQFIVNYFSALLKSISSFLNNSFVIQLLLA
jgi:hypothetical protein